jgi:hypothetical protein
MFTAVRAVVKLICQRIEGITRQRKLLASLSRGRSFIVKPRRPRRGNSSREDSAHYNSASICVSRKVCASKSPEKKRKPALLVPSQRANSPTPIHNSSPTLRGLRLNACEMKTKERYCRTITRNAYCSPCFSRLTNKLVYSLRKFPKSLCVYIKKIQGKNIAASSISHKRVALYCCGARGFVSGAGAAGAVSPFPAGSGRKVNCTPRVAFSFTVRWRSSCDSSITFWPP